MSPFMLSGEIAALTASLFDISVTLATLSFVAIALWSLAWKGVALWFAARNHQKRWFVVLLIVNTVGILDIVYLLWFRMDKREGVTQSLFNNPIKKDSEVASESGS